METIDMLWDQRVFELDGEKYVVNFYCYKFEYEHKNRISGKIISRRDFGVTSDCLFECEGTCIYPSVNPKCPDEDSTEDECPLKKLYKE